MNPHELVLTWSYENIGRERNLDTAHAKIQKHQTKSATAVQNDVSLYAKIFLKFYETYLVMTYQILRPLPSWQIEFLP